MRKKLFGIVLSLMLVAAMIPSMAFAIDAGEAGVGEAGGGDGIYVPPVTTVSPIISIDATIKAPVVGEKPSYNVSINADPSDSAKLVTPSDYWDREEYLTNVDWFYWDETGREDYDWIYIDPNSDYTFEAGKRYAVDIYVDAKAGYYINNATVGKINGVEHNQSIFEENFYIENSGYGCISAEWTLPAATTPTDKPAATTPTDKPATDKSPATGDNADMAPWIALMAIAAVAGTGTVLYRRKNTVK